MLLMFISPLAGGEGEFHLEFCKQHVTTVTFRRILLILFPLFLIPKTRRITGMTGSLKIAMM